MRTTDEIVMKSQQISKMWETTHKVSYDQILTQNLNLKRKTRTHDHIPATCQFVVKIPQ